MTESDLMRVCKDCNQQKPMLDFVQGKFTRLRCRMCFNQMNRDAYAEKVGGLKPRPKQEPDVLKEKARQYAKKWRDKNPDRAKEVARNYEQRKPEIKLARQRRLREEKRDEYNAYNSAKHSRLRRATPAWCDVFILMEAYRLARLRTKMTGIKWSVDHIVPLNSQIVCGLHSHTNIRVVPLSENSSKGNRWWPDMP